ncbi:MAG: hypothetical protein ABSG86_23630 [Thermoguttaceae bacterium]|jgi:hypothetical protein
MSMTDVSGAAEVGATFEVAALPEASGTSEMTEARYTTRQAAPALGLAFSAVDGALRQLGFEPAVGSRGSGKPRRWSLADIVAVKVARECVQRGASWLAVREAMRWIKTGRAGRADHSRVVVLCGREVRVTRPEDLPRSPTDEPVFVWDLPSCFAEVERQLAGSSQGQCGR